MGRKRRTKWVLIAEALAEDIRVGKYKDAAIFPSVRMLARRFDVAFETARESVRMLEVCGLVIRKGSEGTFLTEPETFLWDGLALIQRGDEQFVNEPHVGNAPQKLCFGGEPRAERRARRARKGPRGNPVASSKGTSYFNDMLGTTVGSKSNGKYSPAALTAFGERLDNVDSTSPAIRSLGEGWFTGKPYVEGLGHAFLMRNYRAGLAKWQTADPMGYPDGWNQLAYCRNSVLRFCDIGGAKAGDIYDSIDKAAEEWDNEYNDDSIRDNKEYGSSIYPNGDGYSYTEPDKGNGADTGVSQPPLGKNAVADIHSHAAYDPLYDNDNFSQTDKDDNDRKGIDGYVATPAGILKKYDHISHTVTVISRKIPFDPKHPNRPE